MTLSMLTIPSGPFVVATDEFRFSTISLTVALTCIVIRQHELPHPPWSVWSQSGTPSAQSSARPEKATLASKVVKRSMRHVLLVIAAALNSKGVIQRYPISSVSVSLFHAPSHPPSSYRQVVLHVTCEKGDLVYRRGEQRSKQVNHLAVGCCRLSQPTYTPAPTHVTCSTLAPLSFP